MYTTRPTLEQMANDPNVEAALRQAWADSKPNAPEVPIGQSGSLKQEQGGWIFWNKGTGELEVERVLGGSRDGLVMGARPPDMADREVVGWFHTHPNTVREGYSARPSRVDRKFTRRVGVPGLIETHAGRLIIP
jgi:hypothetical protein